MASSETLNRVYAAIGTLRAKGVSGMNVGLVAAAAGVARSTFYLKDKEWEEVRAVIKGKPSALVKLVQVEVEEKSLATRQIEALSARLAEAEKTVIHIQSTADKVYRELIDEVQRWFVKASEKPGKQKQMARYLHELNSTLKESERLRSENGLLQAQIERAGEIRPLVYKKIISLNALESPGEIFTSFLKQLDVLNSQHGNLHEIVNAYLVCGLPCSGKTRWIESHQPSAPGTHIYVDSCAHTVDIRRFIANRIRDTSKSEVHCVWLRASEHNCVGRVASIAAGRDASVKEEEIRRVASRFEPPVFDEPFNSIILPSEYM